MAKKTTKATAPAKTTITLTPAQLVNLVGQKIKLADAISLPEGHFPANSWITIQSADTRRGPAVVIKTAAGYGALIGFEIEAHEIR